MFSSSLTAELLSDIQKDLNPFSFLLLKYHISYEGHDRTVTLQNGHKNHRTIKFGKDII